MKISEKGHQEAVASGRREAIEGLALFSNLDTVLQVLDAMRGYLTGHKPTIPESCRNASEILVAFAINSGRLAVNIALMEVLRDTPSLRGDQLVAAVKTKLGTT